jgi:hypothetical protein
MFASVSPLTYVPVLQGARQGVGEDRLLAEPSPSVDAELEVDVLDVLLDGSAADRQALGDLPG